MGGDRKAMLYHLRKAALEKAMKSRGINPVSMDRPEGRVCNSVIPGIRPPWQLNMGIKPLPPTMQTYFPSMPSLKIRIDLVTTALWKYRPVAHLVHVFPGQTGRNYMGQSRIRGRGGGDRVLTFTVNYQYSTPEIPKTLLGYERPERRSGWLALVWYANGVLAYHPLVDTLAIGQHIFQAPTYMGTSTSSTAKIGEWRNLEHVAPGQIICNLEMHPGRGGVIARAAGTCCTVLPNKPWAEEKGLVPVLLPSKEVRLLSKSCWCTIGRIGCVDHKFEHRGTAGQGRRLGRKPKVRGMVMTARDHPHGGGCGGRGSAKGGGRLHGPWSVYKRHLPAFLKTGSRTKTSWKLIMRSRQDSKYLSKPALLQWEKGVYSKEDKFLRRAKRFREKVRLAEAKVQDKSQPESVKS